MSVLSGSNALKASDFPSINLTPKNETGVLNFISKNPEFDGRGIVIAVFDSGIDPGAIGLKVTSTGLPKVIERFDCSGAGDVDTSKVVSPDEAGIISGLSGRKLKIPSSWVNPSGQYHIGVKPVFELYTPKVKERIEAKRKEKYWDQQQRLLTAEANRRLTKDQQNGNKNSSDSNANTPLEKLNKEEIEAQLEVLQTLEKKYKDFGPLLDCLLWHDGIEWRASLSTEEDLEAPSNIVLGEFTKRQEFAPLSKADQMNVSINVHDNGNILEIVGICSGHGTHVSSIAAGNFPDNPNLNGVAPGAQIMSFTIGDGRLGSMETGTALVRAMAYVMQNSNRIHVINMSYGEHSHYNAVGRIGELMKEVVDKHGVVWVASAGNHGPALSTVGTPPWLNSNVIIGVGAYVSPEMMSAEYSLRQKLPGMPYSWSSRGPTMDGDLGVSVSAPGGAITSVPNFTLMGAQLMNGTSMAAPHVAGCVAVMLSGAVKKGFKWSPYSVRKALEHSAQQVLAEPFAQGHGLVQVERAFQVLETLSSLPERDVRFDITVTATQGSGSGWPMRAIYIRDPPVDKSKEYTVNIHPIFFNEDVVEPEAKINFRMNLCLLSTVPWVHVPKYFDLANLQRSFNVKVDVEGLPKGVHFGKIEAFDASGLERGAVFTIFVTAIIPEQLTDSPLFRPVLNLPQQLYEPGLLKRYFVTVPKGASWAVLNLKLAEAPGTRPTDAGQQNATARFVVHAMTLNPGQSCKADEHFKMVTLNPLEESTVTFKVTEGKTMEVVVGRWWAEPVELASLSGTLTFRSLSLNKGEVVVSAGDLYQKFTVNNGFAIEDVSPAAVLKHQVSLLRPTESRIVSLPEPRDCIPNGRVIYQLENTYNFSLSRASEATFNCCLLSDTLYESEYESQMWQLYDKNKRFLGSGDAYPSKWNVKLEKGDFVLRLSCRHDKREALEKLMVGNAGTNGVPTNTTTWSGDSQIPSLPILVSLKLPSSIALDVFQNQYELQDYKGTKKGTGWSSVLKRESSLNLFLSTIITDKNLKTLPSSSTLYLQGSLTVHKDEIGKKLVTYPLKVTLPESPPKAKSTSSSNKDSTKTKKDEMTEQLRDIQINWITKLEADDSRKLYETLMETYDSHLPLHSARLQFLDNGGAPTPSSSNGDAANTSSSSDSGIPSPPRSGGSDMNTTTSSTDSNTNAAAAVKKRAKTPEICKEMIQIADKVLGLVDQPALLAFIGNRSSAQLDNGKTKQVMDKQRSAVIDALIKKGLAIAELLKLNDASSTSSTDSSVTIEALDSVLFEIQKYLDINDARVMEFAYHHAMARKHYGRALKLLLKNVEAEPGKWSSETDDKIINVFKALEWSHCVWLWEGTHLLRFPAEYRPF